MDEFEFGKVPEGIDRVWARKQVNSFLKKARVVSKPEKCIICGKQTTRFCNSHSVPRAYLKNIAEDGKVLQANGLIGAEIIDVEKGLNNSGTFQFICSECDGKLFQTYEDPNLIKDEKPSDKLLAEIALKDSLLMLSKRNTEKAIFREATDLGRLDGSETMFEIQDLDTRDFKEEMDLYLKITDTSLNSFHIVYHSILPYRVPIAVQTGLALQKDLEGTEINDIYNLSHEVRMQFLHISVFPLENETVILVFFHRRDKNYRRLMHQFKCLPNEDKVRHINYWIFKYTENYFLTPSFGNRLKKNSKLVQLSRENNELPNMGFVTLNDMLQYKPVDIDELPIILSKEFAFSDTV